LKKNIASASEINTGPNFHEYMTADQDYTNVLATVDIEGVPQYHLFSMNKSRPYKLRVELTRQLQVITSFT
jgi:hypothetical protein